MEKKLKSTFKEILPRNNIPKDNTNRKIKDQSISMSHTNNLNNINKILSYNYLDYKMAKTCTKPIGKLKSYGANSYIGLTRNYNEDRIKIINKVTAPNSTSDEDWPEISYFAIFDGHGGNKCANFLKENLHNYVNKIIKPNYNRYLDRDVFHQTLRKQFTKASEEQRRNSF